MDEKNAEEHLVLKWGTLKGWSLKTDASLDALKRYFADRVSASAMLQDDTPDQKRAICDLIDALDGNIDNDWTGEPMTKEEAKKYVMEYGT